MVCKSCNNSKKSSNDFTRAVIEIDNPDKLVLLRKVVIPASMGTKDNFPPTIGKYYNTLLQYEASGDLYLYSSDGIPTQLSSDVSELQRQLEQLGLKVDKEILDRIAADAALNNSINTVSGSLSDEVTARQNADNALQGNITALDNSLATVAKSGSYNDLSNKPTIGNATLTIKKNGSNVGTFTANATANKNIDISVPTKTSDLTNDGSDGTSTYVETKNLPTIGNATLTITENNTPAGTFTANATSNKTINITSPTKTSDLTNDGSDGTSTYVESDDLPTVDTTYSSSSNNAIANSTVTNSLDRNVMTNLTLDSTTSTTTVNLNNTKTNLAQPSSTTTSSISLPVASSTQAGVMNSSTFNAIASNTSNINAILSGAVAITGLPASPTQAELTTAWENETGLTSLMNRAGIYDVTNSKVWTYYTNDSTWYAASNTSQVTVSTFTNSSEGLIKGSTNDGQVFAENDGTGSVNGWDTLTSAVSNNTSKLATIAQGAEVNVQANWTQSNTSADDYIKNKPTIPTVNNATLTIQKNGTNVQTFTANSSTNKTANITVPTAVSELTNDANYATTTQLNDGLATKQNTLTAGSNITIANDTISATDTTYTAGNAIDITNNVISADIYPADFFTAGKNVSGEGIDITLNNTINAPIENVELKGDTYQQTYSGKNLFDSSSYATKSDSGNVSLGVGSVRMTQTVVGNAGGNCYVGFDINKPELRDKEVVIFMKAVSGGGSTGSRVRVVTMPAQSDIGSLAPTSSGSALKFTIPSDGAIRIYFYANASNVAGVVGAYTEYTNIQLEVGDTATAYEPYCGGTASPNPDYPQDVNVVTGGQTVTVTGKNLNVYPYTGGGNGRGITFTPNSDGTVTLNGQNDGRGNSIYFFLNNKTRVIPAGTYYMIPSSNTRVNYVMYDGTRYYSFSSSNGYSVTFDTDTSIRQFYVQTYDNAITFSDFKVYPMLTTQANPTEADYEPYQSQEYEVNLGKNLFNKNDLHIFRGYISNAGVLGQVETDLSTGQDRSIYVKCEPNTTYTVTKPLQHTTGNNRFALGTQSVLNISSGQQLSDSWSGGDGTTTTTHTVTTSNDAHYLIIFIGKATDRTNPGGEIQDILDGLQIEKGATATEYAPYFEPIELCKIGTYQDYIYKSGDDWYVHNATMKAILNGTEEWELTNVTTGYTRAFIGGVGFPTQIGYCDRFTPRVSAHGAYEYVWFQPTTIGGLYIQIKTERLADNTLAAFKAWLSNNPTKVVYALSAATDTKITDATLVGQLEALWNANTYLDTTHFFVTATGSNLPVILDIEAYRKSLDGVLKSIPDAQVQADWTEDDTTAADYIKNKPTLATVATTGSYNDLANKPTIPTVNDATLTIKKNGSTVTTFTANSSTNQIADISVPVITMTTTDPGEGSPLAANNFIGVYE